MRNSCVDYFETRLLIAARRSPESPQGQMWRSVMVSQGWITTVTSQPAAF